MLKGKIFIKEKKCNIQSTKNKKRREGKSTRKERKGTEAVSGSGRKRTSSKQQ